MPFGVCENVVFQVAHRILRGEKKVIQNSAKHGDQPALYCSIQDGLTSCYTEKQSVGGSPACQPAQQLAECKTPAAEDSPRLHVQERKGCSSFSKENAPTTHQNAPWLGHRNILKLGQLAESLPANLCPLRSQ